MKSSNVSKCVLMVNGCWLVQETEHSGMTASTVDRKRRIASIFQHYYPEGGWGLVLLLSVVLVQEMSTNLLVFTVPENSPIPILCSLTVFKRLFSIVS